MMSPFLKTYAKFWSLNGTGAQEPSWRLLKGRTKFNVGETDLIELQGEPGLRNGGEPEADW